MRCSGTHLGGTLLTPPDPSPPCDAANAEKQLFCDGGGGVQTACSQPRQQFGHVCVADEHFVPTLFAAYGLEEGRDGIGELTYTDWLSAQGSWHPTTFHPGAAQAGLFTMRQRTQYSKCARPSPPLSLYCMRQSAAPHASLFQGSRLPPMHHCDMCLSRVISVLWRSWGCSLHLCCCGVRVAELRGCV